MVETRPAMTAEQFAEAASYVYPGWWATGENLVHVPEVMNVTGWDLYGHPGNQSLTEAQRVLMMWSDLVGQVSNGGFTQFIYNFRKQLALAHRLIGKLGWSDLMTRFEDAFREQVGDSANPGPLGQTVPADPEKYALMRASLIRKIARKGKKFWQPVTPEELTRAEQTYEEFLMDADLPIEWIDPPVEKAEAFTRWFYTDLAKTDSCEYVGAFIVSNRDQLCRIVD